MLLSLRKNGLTSLFKEVRVFKGPFLDLFSGFQDQKASRLLYMAVPIIRLPRLEETT